jgi:hypothetical protein
VLERVPSGYGYRMGGLKGRFAGSAALGSPSALGDALARLKFRKRNYEETEAFAKLKQWAVDNERGFINEITEYTVEPGSGLESGCTEALRGLM